MKENRMAIVSPAQFFKLQTFVGFWERELAKSACGRVKSPKFVDSVFSRHARNIKSIGERIMAKKATTKKAFKWNGYCNVNVPESMSGEVDAWLRNEKKIMASYNEMLMSSYQIKIYYDSERERMVANAICHDGDSDNFGFALSAFAEDWYTALSVMIFKHLYVCEGDWNSAASSTTQPYG